MARDINRILSKSKWTGEELGRILLAELVRSIQVAKGDIEKSDPIITDKDLVSMEKGLETDRNYNVYNTFRNLYFQITKNYNQGANYMNCFQGAYNREVMHLSDCYNYERTKTEQSRLPVIVTKSKYEELTKGAREKLANVGESYAGLIITLAGWFSTHTDQAPAGFAEALEATKKEQVTNKDIAQAWLNEVEGYCLVLPNGLRSDTATQEEWEAGVKETFMQKYAISSEISTRVEEMLPDYFMKATDFGKAVAFHKYAESKLMLRWLWEGEEGLKKDFAKIKGNPSAAENISKEFATLQELLEEDNTDLYDLLDISNYSKADHSKEAFTYAEDQVTEVLLYEELPQTVTKYNIIKEGYFLYYGDFEGAEPKGLFTSFTKDYPALFDILNKFVQETLPVFKGIKPANYSKLLISYAELERLGIADYTTNPTKESLAQMYAETDNFDYLTYKRIQNSGYAVLQDFVKGIADTGEIKVHSDLRLAVNLEALEAIEIMKTNMLKARETLFLPAIKYLLAYNSLIDIYRETFDFEELTKIKVNEKDIELKLDSYNDLLFLLYKAVFGSGEQQKHKRELIKTLFKPLYIEDFKPTAQAITQVETELNDLGFTKAGREKLAETDYYLNILLGEKPTKKHRG